MNVTELNLSIPLHRFLTLLMVDAAIESSTETPVLSSIPNRKPVRVYLPIKEKSQYYRTQAVYRSTSPPFFELYFKPGALPLADLDSNKNCLINVDFGGPTLSLTAAIVSVSDRTLSGRAEKLINHAQMRQFFRVDAVTDVISKSFQPEFFSSSGKSWSMQGRTIDISGNGLLACFDEQPPADEMVRLELSLPGSHTEIISVVAKTVRIQPVDQHHWDAAFHFQDISDDDRDRIVGCCLEIQRRHLRLKAELDS
jgi:hypothetical protein